MEVSARSYVMAGVALVGAGAIAVAPVQPLPVDMQVRAASTVSTPVELNALVNPLTLWTDVIATTVSNVGGIAQTVVADPAPIASNIIGNQLITAELFAELAAAFGSGFIQQIGLVPQMVEEGIRYGILEGDIYGGVQAVATAFISPILAGALPALFKLPDISAALQNPLLNAASVIETTLYSGLVGIGLPLLTMVLTPVAQIGMTGQKIYDAMQADDIEGAVNAVISLPSDMTGAILNGSPELGTGGGLLGSALDGGLVAGLLNFRKAVADAIHPPALSPQAVSLNVGATSRTALKEDADESGGDTVTSDEVDATDDGPVVRERVGSPRALRALAAGKESPRAKVGLTSLRDDVDKPLKRLGADLKKFSGSFKLGKVEKDTLKKVKPAKKRTGKHHVRKSHKAE